MNKFNKLNNFKKKDNPQEAGKMLLIPDISIPQGPDARVATCRGKLQNRRSKLNQEINKELRLRAGAENLYKATTNRKLRETVAIELSFVNSNLQLLKEKLAQLNSSVEVYQSDSTDAIMPMIPLGLKETKEIDFHEPFKDFILEHYSEDTSEYEDAISEFMEIRQAVRTPSRDVSGIALLFRYYNQLYFVERRFFSPDRSLGIYFEWFDSLTGVPSCQRTVAFEKACVLFNMGALYTQIGAKQDRTSTKGLDSAVDSFLRAAGTFRYIYENFANAPSMDLGTDMLEMFVQLMLGQARECLLEKLVIQSQENRSVDICLDLAQEASYLSECYCHAHQLMSNNTVHHYIPYSWTSLVLVKKEYYAGIAHYYFAKGILLSEYSKSGSKNVNEDSTAKNECTIDIPDDEVNRKNLAKGHLREALVLLEEGQRLHRMCRELKGKLAMAAVLRNAHKSALEFYTKGDNDDDFADVFDPPQVPSSTKFQLNLTPPDFSQYRVNDLFKALGPLAFFSAKRYWSAPRLIQLHRSQPFEGFGFSVKEDNPVIIAMVESNSLAEFGGVREGDIIVAVGDKDVKWSSQSEVVHLIKNVKNTLSLKVVSPMEKEHNKACKLGKASAQHNSLRGSSEMSSPTGSMGNQSSSKRIGWNLFKKYTHSRDGKYFYDNIILR